MSNSALGHFRSARAFPGNAVRHSRTKRSMRSALKRSLPQTTLIESPAAPDGPPARRFVPDADAMFIPQCSPPRPAFPDTVPAG